MTLAQTIETHVFGLNYSCDVLVLNVHIRVKFVSLLDIYTWRKLELSLKSNHLSWWHYSATHTVPPVRSGCYYDRRSPMFLWNFHTSPSFQQLKDNSYVAFAAAAFKSLEYFLIAIATQVRCFRNSEKTSTWPLSAAAGSAVKSHFLAICTIPPLLSNARCTSTWILLAVWILSFHRFLYVVCILLGISPASEV